jgi:hypothetical protein
MTKFSLKTSDCVNAPLGLELSYFGWTAKIDQFFVRVNYSKRRYVEGRPRVVFVFLALGDRDAIWRPELYWKSLYAKSINTGLVRADPSPSDEELWLPLNVVINIIYIIQMYIIYLCAFIYEPKIYLRKETLGLEVCRNLGTWIASRSRSDASHNQKTSHVNLNLSSFYNVVPKTGNNVWITILWLFARQTVHNYVNCPSANCPMANCPSANGPTLNCPTADCPTANCPTAFYIHTFKPYSILTNVSMS